MVYWEHCYLLGTMIFTIAGDVVRDFDEVYDAWNWLERDGWGLVAIEPPDPIRPGVCKYYFKRQHIAQKVAHERFYTTGKEFAVSSETDEHRTPTNSQNAIRRGKRA
jgi:hypothetical protein